MLSIIDDISADGKLSLVVWMGVVDKTFGLSEFVLFVLEVFFLIADNGLEIEESSMRLTVLIALAPVALWM